MRQSRTCDGITRTQFEALELAGEGSLSQYHGGRWAKKVDADANPAFWQQKPAPITFVLTNTVLALKRRGFLESDGDYEKEWRRPLRLTALGRDCLDRHTSVFNRHGPAE